MSYERLPLPPDGIYRDDTQHGKLYFTLAQIRAYGQECAEDAIREIDRARAKHNGQKPDDTVDFLRGMMGMK